MAPAGIETVALGIRVAVAVVLAIGDACAHRAQPGISLGCGEPCRVLGLRHDPIGLIVFEIAIVDLLDAARWVRSGGGRRCQSVSGCMGQRRMWVWAHRPNIR